MSALATPDPLNFNTLRQHVPLSASQGDGTPQDSHANPDLEAYNPAARPSFSPIQDTQFDVEPVRPPTPYREAEVEDALSQQVTYEHPPKTIRFDTNDSKEESAEHVTYWFDEADKRDDMVVDDVYEEHMAHQTDVSADYERSVALAVDLAVKVARSERARNNKLAAVRRLATKRAARNKALAVERRRIAIRKASALQKKQSWAVKRRVAANKATALERRRLRLGNGPSPLPGVQLADPFAVTEWDFHAAWLAM